MSYKVQIRPHLRRGLSKIGLSDFVLTDVYLRLYDQLQDHPWQVLRRTVRPFNGMTFSFTLIDPENRLYLHGFAFHVVYGQDEETLHIVRMEYGKQVSL